MKKHLPTFLVKSTLIILSIIFCGNYYAQAQQVQVTLTGYSIDVVADPLLNTDPSVVSTGTIDPTGSMDLLFAEGYSNNSTPYLNGLPVTGQFTSSLNHDFQMAPFDQNNDLNLQAGESGTLTFDVTNQIPYDSLFILATGGNGNVNNVSYTINFSDLTTETGTFTINDWFCNGCDPYAISGLSRIRLVNGNLDGSNTFALREYLIPLLPGNQSKNVVSVDFSVPLGGMSVANIFGITGYMAGSLPVTLEYFNVKAQNGLAVLQWKTSQEFNSSKFIIERASSSNPSSFVQVGEVNATSSANGSLYTFTNDALVSGNYLYRLLQVDIDSKTKVLGIRSISFNTKVKWMIQDLGTQWQLISNGPFAYRLIDMQGRVLRAATGSGSITIAKPGTHGIYEIQVQSGSEFSTKKLFK
jgi:hypothetical protein